MSVHVLRCPNCGADLDVADGIEAIRCRYCRTPCRVDWRGADPLLTREAQEFVEALNAIDLDALEKGLDEVNAMLDADQQRKQLLDETIGSLTKDEKLDQMARQLIESGKASEFLQGVDDLPNDSAEPHLLPVRDMMQRLASRIRTIQRQNSVAAIAAAREGIRERADLAQRQREMADEKALLTNELAKSRQGSAYSDREYALALRTKYQRSRFWAVAGFPPMLLFFLGLGAMFVYFDWSTWLWWVGWVLIVISPLVALQFSVDKWKEGTEAARKFNETASLHGLPEIRVKSSS